MIYARQSGLGKGLGALIPPVKPTPPAPAIPSVDSVADERSHSAVADGQRVLELSVAEIERNPHQPRVVFDHAQLEDLIVSIKEHGILQPLIVTALPTGRYQLVAGERRLRAATIAGLATVPAMVREASEQQKLEWALIENIQRHDLNPLEEARAYLQLMEEFQLTQEEVAKKVGKSRPLVANTIRLLQLPEAIQQALMERKISSSNGRTLLSLATDAERLELFQAMLAGNFTVRQTEDRVQRQRRSPLLQDPNVQSAEKDLRAIFGCPVSIVRQAEERGDIRLRFSSGEEFASLVNQLKRGQMDSP